MKNSLFIGLCFLFVVLCARHARADEELRPIAVDGNWIALAHYDSLTAPPDVCIAFNPQSEFGVRADGNDIEFRLSNSSWELPTSVTGTLDITINNHAYSFDIDINTDTQVSATVQNDQFMIILGDIMKAGSMKVAPGKGQPETVSLAGSTKIFTAFMTCAGLNMPDSSRPAGANPFQ
jgi:hypothetical protein